MDLILCHVAADFDTLGAAVGAARLYPEARIVLTGGAHPSVREFLSLYRDAFPILELRAVDPTTIRKLILVDCGEASRLGKAAAWLEIPGIEIHVYDHHLGSSDHPIPQALCHIEPVGSTCTLIVERLQAQRIQTLSPFEVLVLALGLHMDTGSLTFPSATVRDAQALLWLMQQELNLTLLSRYLVAGMSPQIQELLSQGLNQLQVESVGGYQLGLLILHLHEFVGGLAGLVMHLMDLTEMDVLILVASQGERLSLIGRARYDFAQLHLCMQTYGGGGHSRAAAATCKGETRDPQALGQDILEQIKGRIPQPQTAQDLMSSPVRTILPETPISEAQRVLLRYGHSGLVVVNDQAELVGVISRRDIDIALHHGFGHAPVKGYMTTSVKTVQPHTPFAEIQALMMKWDIGRLPVVDKEQLLGIVTRTDVLRHLHDLPSNQISRLPPDLVSEPQRLSLKPLGPRYLEILTEAAAVADQMGLQLFLVGGAVRDLLLDRPTDDLDLVVDGPYPLSQEQEIQEGWGIKLGRALQQRCPEARLEIHGKFQTVALHWPDGIWIDIATSRTEFYPYPAAPPEVALGSIQQDLYRRDFTINALALRLNGTSTGQILDFFGGLDDLETGRIRVLHANSFIEDPTRIFRAVRFATRLGFEVEAQTVTYISSAISSGLLDAVGGDRLKNELSFILMSSNWPQALDQLAAWQALRCLHPDLTWSPQLQQQIRRVGAWAYHFQFTYPEISHSDLWQLRLERMLCQLQDAATVAEQLHLTQAGIERLRLFPYLERQVLPCLHADLAPSQVVMLLSHHKVLDLILLAAVAPRPARRILYPYLSAWRQGRPLLSGHDLKAMGYTPGPRFRQILTDLHHATLDQRIGSAHEARTFVQEHYPLSPSSG